jgi:hypothetical protein
MGSRETGKVSKDKMEKKKSYVKLIFVIIRCVPANLERENISLQ